MNAPESQPSTCKRQEPLHVGKPNVCDLDDFVEAVRGIFDRRYLTNNGPVVQEFETALCNFLGVSHCIPVCNATIGLLLLARELETSTTGEPAEVIVPSFTFVATAHSLLWQNLKPKFCDIDPKTHNLDPAQVERLIGPNTKGILGVHVWGRPCAIDELEQIARAHHLPLFFDAAHAFACSHRGRMIGNFGNAEVFSFHATKVLNTFEGGAIATNDDELARRIRLAMNFGFSGIDTVEALGINAKMNEISAAMGLCSLRKLSEFIEVNRRNYREYQKLFSGIPGLTLEPYPEDESMNFHYVVARIDRDEAGFSRDELVAYLFSENIFVRRYFSPGCHQMEPYRSQFTRAENLFHSERLSETVICFPNGTNVELEDVHRIADLVAGFQQRHTTNQHGRR